MAWVLIILLVAVLVMAIVEFAELTYDTWRSK
jgi:hypothetical protein